jgi:hypothetical protein
MPFIMLSITVISQVSRSSLQISLAQSQNTSDVGFTQPHFANGLEGGRSRIFLHSIDSCFAAKMVGLSMSGDDVLFWERMASLDPSLDRADMAASVAFPRPMPLIELIVSTPAGKPIYHFSHGYLPMLAPESDRAPETFQRPRQDLLTLCAMAFAFAGVAPDVSHVRTQAGALFFASKHSLYVTVAAASSRFSVRFWRPWLG